MVVYPGGVLTGLFNRPEASAYHRMYPLQKNFMQHCPKAVSCYIKTLENGYEQTYGTVFCELFNFVWFKILGLMPGFDTKINFCLAEYFGAPFDKEM